MPPSRVSEPRACETINTISFARTLVAAGCNAPHSSQRAAVKPQNEKASRGKQAAVRGEEAVAQRIARPLSGRSEARLPPTVAYGRTSDGCGKELRALRKNCNGTCGVYAQAKQATGGARQAHCKRVEAWTCRSSGEFYYVGRADHSGSREMSLRTGFGTGRARVHQGSIGRYEFQRLQDRRVIGLSWHVCTTCSMRYRRCAKSS